MNPEQLNKLDEMIGKTLAEYDAQKAADHARTEEEANWMDLCVMVNGGLMTEVEAERRHIDWLAKRDEA